MKTFLTVIFFIGFVGFLGAAIVNAADHAANGEALRPVYTMLSVGCFLASCKCAFYIENK